MAKLLGFYTDEKGRKRPITPSSSERKINIFNDSYNDGKRKETEDGRRKVVKISVSELYTLYKIALKEDKNKTLNAILVEYGLEGSSKAASFREHARSLHRKGLIKYTPGEPVKLTPNGWGVLDAAGESGINYRSYPPNKIIEFKL
ncbi:MAG: hypothetical protein QXP04_01225 [Candidatus Nanoarchaeia archaeon]|nr:hypothetical protein [Candidatus Jingweiarchaeum tengchongense]